MAATFEGKEHVSDLMNDNKPEVDFVVFTLTDKTKFEVKDGHAGKGGLAKVKEILAQSEDTVTCGAFLVLAVDDRGTTVSVRRKYIGFTFVGPNVSVLTKGRVNSQQGAIQEILSGIHIFNVFDDADDLSEEFVESRLRSAGGAHQPTHFDFQNDFEKYK